MSNGISIENSSIGGNDTKELDTNVSFDPKHWSRSKKWLITIVFSLNSFVLTMGSSIITPGIPNIELLFGCKQVVAILSISLYVLGQTIGPLIFSPLSEVYGRNIIHIPTWFCYCVFQIACAKAKNIEMLLICRLIVGIAGSPAVSVAAGSVTDIWSTAELGPPIGIFASSAFLGPVAGPVIGGYIVEYAPGGSLESWRWTMWTLLIISGAIGLNFIWIPEGHANTIERRRFAKEGTQRADSRAGVPPQHLWSTLKTSMFRPVELLILDPIVLLMCLYMAFIFGVLYIYFGAYPVIFTLIRGWNTGPSGLAFLGIGFGVLLSMGTSTLGNRLYFKLLAKHNVELNGPCPEARLPLALLATIAAPGSAFWFAWTGSFTSIHWIVPILSGVPFGWSMVTLFSCLIGYLAEAYYTVSASAIGCAAIMRSLFAFSFPLFMPDMYTNLKPQWAGTLLACILLLFLPIPWIFYLYGAKIRAKSKYTVKNPSTLG